MDSFKNFMNNKGEIEKEDIKKIIPYGDEFLLVDKVLKIEDNRIIAEKHINKEDPVLKAHFKDFPIYPGALIVEGLGQAATILIRSKIEDHNNKYVLAYMINSAKFIKPIFPGDVVIFDISYKRGDATRAQVETKAIVNNHTVSECDMTIAIVNKNEFRSKYGK